MFLPSRENIKFDTIVKNNIKEIYFNSPMPSGILKVDRAKALLFEANNSENALIFIHGTGSKNFIPLQYYAKSFAKSGHTTLMPVLPYHFDRIPDGNKEANPFLSGTSEDMEKKFYIAINDILACIDYLEKNGYKKINIMGFSFGGMIAVISMALDKRISKGVVAVSGGNFEYITWHSIATKVFRLKYESDGSASPNKCHKIHETFDNEAKNFSGIDKLIELPSCFRYDPSLFASMIDSQKIIMFSALMDPFIPRKSSKDLWNRLGNPKRYLLPCGHLTSHVFFKHFIFKTSLKFLDNSTFTDKKQNPEKHRVKS